MQISMVVLNRKIDDGKWKKFLYISKTIPNELTYRDEVSEYIMKLSFNNAIALNRQNIWRLIDRVSELSEHQAFIETLQMIDTYYIYKDKFYPQVTVSYSENMYRYFYHPLYTCKKQYIDVLVSSLYPQSKVYYFDINGAIIRALFLVGFIHLKHPVFLKWFNFTGDIYTLVTSLCNIKGNASREQVKRLIITSVFKRDTEFFKNDSIKYILSNFTLAYICKVLNLYILKSIPQDAYLFHFNFDGGYIVYDRELTLPNFWRVELIKS